ncbi:50S ribosomal protein P1 [Methanolobus psychrotolerans]|uniref:50S ribosomal protein P1 n=1 Tax=Methanolobus psychrotolerans TaxID=1874706 RepID=UPI000B915A7E|nr:50S ribosomal protein P1 [Methanolobus psychrotolerans]
MEYIYAALLLFKAGKDITEETVTAVLQAAGVEVNDARAKALVAALEGVDIEEAMATAAVAAAPAAAAPVAAAPAPVEEAAPEEEDHSEENGMAGLGALFG